MGGNAGVGLDGNHGDEDELFEEAKAIIIKAGKASTSMLQRRLSIGYGRAAKILDMLEEAGIIGPSNGAKPREVMVSAEQYEAMGASPISAMPVHNRAEASAPDNYLGEETEEEDGDDLLVFKGQEDAPEISEEEEVEIEKELELTPAEEEKVIEDEDEILEEIRGEKEEEAAPTKTPNAEKSTVSKKHNPLEDDDEMFFAK